MGAPIRYPKLQDRSWLVEQYVDLERTLADIARQLGCSGAAVRCALDRHEIRARVSARPAPVYHTGPVDLSPVYSRQQATPRAGCRCDRPLSDEDGRCLKCGK